MATSQKVFGHIAGYPKGSAFSNRPAASKAGLHTPYMQGISGNGADGVNSIVVSGGYKDDEDYGSHIIYTGHGGQDANGKQVADQSLSDPGNAGLVTSQLRGLPVRVLRGSKGEPEYSPQSGFRYDGLFQVTEHWSSIGIDGHRIWQFRLEELNKTDAESWQPPLPTGNANPGVQQSTVTRVTRDTKVSRSVKDLHNDACQVCGIALKVPGGTTSEGAHIRALKKPHNGPDTPDNVLCLCPNHHTLLDNGGIYVDESLHVRDMNHQVIGPLRLAKGHTIDLAHLEYHRSLWNV